MRKPDALVLSEPWMKRLKIAPMPIESDLLDLNPTFRARLKESLSHGWSQDQYLVVAASDDPRLDGQILQGRHRVLCISELIQSGVKFNTGAILIRREDVSTADELRAKRAAYEAASSLTKDAKMSKKWIQANLNPLIEKKASEGKAKILSYLHESGFQNDSVAVELIDSVLNKLANKAKQVQKRKGVAAALPPHLKDPGQWTPQPGAQVVDEVSTSYFRTVKHSCEKCGAQNEIHLNIAVGNRTITKLELALPIVEK